MTQNIPQTFKSCVAELVKRLDSMPMVSGSNLLKAQKMFKNHFKYFSATFSQKCIQHDELGWLVTGLTEKLKPLRSCVKSLDCGSHLLAKREELLIESWFVKLYHRANIRERSKLHSKKIVSKSLYFMW